MEIFVLAFFALGYLVLGGADIGVGMALPYLGRTQGERREVIAAIAPFFLGNEVWLVAAIGVVAGHFPRLENELLSGNYRLIVVLLVSWVLRDMGLWSRGRVAARRWQGWWDGVIVAGSWGMALSWGILLGHVLLGVEGPIALVAAAASAALFGAHGLAFARLRLRGAPHRRASAPFGGAGEGLAFTLTAAGLAGVGVLAGFRLPLEAGPSWALLGPVILPFIPLLVAAQAWVWWIFRHRVSGPSYL